VEIKRYRGDMQDELGISKMKPNSIKKLKKRNNLGGSDAIVRIMPTLIIEVQQFQNRVQ
jgi:hypothetical protein